MWGEKVKKKVKNDISLFRRNTVLVLSNLRAIIAR